MKNKRTKLAALLLSALMAVSTISSVTWAADLFSDGSEETDIDPSEIDNIASTVEDEASSFEETEILNAGSVVPGSVQCDVLYDTETGGYYGLLKYQTDDGNWVGPSKVEVHSTNITEPGNCQEPPKEQFSFKIGSTEYFTWLELTNGWKQGDHSFVTHTVEVLMEADCTNFGLSVTYSECTGCHQIKDITKDNDVVGGSSVAGVESAYTMLGIDSYDDYIKVNNKKDTSETRSEYKNDVDKKVASNNMLVVTIHPSLGHDWVGPTKSNIPANTNPDYDASKTLSQYQTEGNCTVEKGVLIGGAMYPDRDAYYYNVYECSRCKAQKDDGKYVFFYANMKEGDKFYLAGEGVKGFIINGKVGSKKIKESEFTGEQCVALENCENGGVYYLVTMNASGTEATRETFYKKAEHSWGYYQFVINYNGKKYIRWDEKGKDVKSYYYSSTDPTQTVDADGLSTETAFAIDPKTKTIKIGKDKNGLPTLYSLHCNETAYFELERTCVSCGSRDPSIVVGSRKATAGDHVWDENKRYTDPTKTEYLTILDKEGNVDKEHHLEKYWDNVVCKLCGARDTVRSLTPDATVDHKFESLPVEGTRNEPNCGKEGSFKRADTCPCGYIDESSTTTVTIPATDKHDFGNNPAEIFIDGEAFIKNDFIDGVSCYVTIGRKCTICGEYDANGINTEKQEKGKVGMYTIQNYHAKNNNKPIYLNVDPDSINPAKKDSNGVTLPCSTSTARVYVNWVGTVDGVKTELNIEKLDVPYYDSIDIYRGRTAHRWDDGVRTSYTAPTETTDGECDIVYTCEVCGETKTVHQVIPKLDPTVVPATPTVQAVSAGYNSINVSWNAVEGADHYRLYYKSADLGVVSWKLLKTVTGTSFAHTGLVTGAKYRYTVRAVQNGVKGDYSKTGSVAVPKLATPENITVTAVSGKNKVSWSKVDGANGYIIQRSTGNGWTRVGSVKKGAKVTWTDKKPVSGATYRVRAYRTVNDANFSKNNVYSAFSAAK